MTITITLDTAELETFIDKRVEARVAALLPAPVKGNPMPGPREFKAHAVYALKHSFPHGAPLADVAQRILANGYRHVGRYEAVAQIKANLSALANTDPQEFYRPRRGWIARR
jgi:hypothetical protein